MNDFNLAAAISKAVWNETDHNTIRQALVEFRTELDQISFFEYCKKYKLAPWTYIQLSRAGLIATLSPKAVKILQDEYEKVKLKNTNRNKTALLFLQEFKNAGINVVVLKGNYLAHSIYKDIGYKRMNDFDMLVHRKDWDKIQDIYLNLNYIPLGFGWSGEKEEPADFSHVGMSYISADLACITGTQWGLKSPTTTYTEDLNETWATTENFDFEGLALKSLSPEQNILHLILHMGIYKCSIRDCMDIYNIMLCQKVNLDVLETIIIKTNATDKAVFTMKMCNLCCHTFPDSFITSLSSGKRSFINRRLKSRLKMAAVTGDFQLSYNDYFHEVENQVIYFNLFSKFHIKLKYYLKVLRMLFFPKRDVSLRLNDKMHSSTFFDRIVSSLKAPFLIFSMLAEEIGWKFTILLFCKLFFDLIYSIKNYFVKSASYFSYLIKKGIDPKTIEKAVKEIE